jgi:hypothetical protein
MFGCQHHGVITTDNDAPVQDIALPGPEKWSKMQQGILEYRCICETSHSCKIIVAIFSANQSTIDQPDVFYPSMAPIVAYADALRRQ